MSRASEALGAEDGGSGTLRPLVSAADAGPQSYTRVHFDDAIARCVRHHAHERAPTSGSRFRHLVGMAGEAAAAAALGVPANRELLPDYDGDDGHDLTVPVPGMERPARVEVRTTTDHERPERRVGAAEVDDADYYVLCRTDAPGSYVELVGYAPRRLVKLCGGTYWGEGYRLRTDYLLPMDARRLGPDAVREVFRREHDRGRQ